MARNYNSKTRDLGPEVPVVGYEKGQRVEESIQVSETPSGPVNPGGIDVEAVAQPLNRAVYDRLTRTMQKFTLFDKVALITG